MYQWQVALSLGDFARLDYNGSIFELIIKLQPISKGASLQAKFAGSLINLMMGQLYALAVVGGRVSDPIDQDWASKAYTAVQDQIGRKSQDLVTEEKTAEGGCLGRCLQWHARNPYVPSEFGACVRPHAIFGFFNAWEVPGNGLAGRSEFLVADAMGVQTRAEFLCYEVDTPARELACARHQDDALSKDGQGQQCLGPCIVDDEYFQWIEVLQAVASASKYGHFSMVELGADHGPWTARALAGWRRLKGEPLYKITCSAVAVESNPDLAWRFEQHLADNHLRCIPRVTTLTGKVGPDPNAVLLRDVLFRLESAQAHAHAGSVGSTVAPISVLHMDVQGAEGHVVRCGLQDGSLRRIQRLIIGTHSRNVHWELETLLQKAGWEIIRSFLPWSISATNYGHIAFRDGLVVALNHALDVA